jgi:hypothetical protein
VAQRRAAPDASRDRAGAPALYDGRRRARARRASPGCGVGARAPTRADVPVRRPAPDAGERDSHERPTRAARQRDGAATDGSRKQPAAMHEPIMAVRNDADPYGSCRNAMRSVRNTPRHDRARRARASAGGSVSVVRPQPGWRSNDGADDRVAPWSRPGRAKREARSAARAARPTPGGYDATDAANGDRARVMPGAGGLRVPSIAARAPEAARRGGRAGRCACSARRSTTPIGAGTAPRWRWLSARVGGGMRSCVPAAVSESVWLGKPNSQPSPGVGERGSQGRPAAGAVTCVAGTGSWRVFARPRAS